MTAWATAFLIVALVSATLAFGGVPGLAVSIAKLIFVAAVAAAAITWLLAKLRRRARDRLAYGSTAPRAEREE
ncbi:DUF1328 domain-containing protein [Bosea sp. PAMC 26642]|uniref:DUF1328 domain-containing protein n=1 Tax=Bosea sp. (strain PAMC 26642) TaxID=1792307 RepID=UPI00077048C1|nr:DUF1328 domain-containing protein [Bosea sp. PAMC 26642]AMJ62528.1 hypothetical protein AXW83_21460 [Bosea sp. PAMC 26642]